MYCLAINVLAVFTILLTLYPDTHFMTFVFTLIPFALLYRHVFWVFLDTGRNIFFGTDFCYFGTYTLLYWWAYGVKNEELFRMIFIFGNGVQLYILWLNVDRLVLFDSERMINFTIHCIPMFITQIVRWKMIPGEEGLPEDQKVFCSITDDVLFDSFFVQSMILNSLKFYFAWFIPYCILNYVIFDSMIEKYNYTTLFTVYKNYGVGKYTMEHYGKFWSIVSFMSIHLAFFIASSVSAIVAFYNFYFGIAVAFMIIQGAIHRGAIYTTSAASKVLKEQQTKIERLESHLEQEEM
jgi:hypothetical protein